MLNEERRKPVEQIQNALTEVVTKPDLIKIGEEWAHRARSQGVKAVDVQPIFVDIFGGGDLKTTTR